MSGAPSAVPASVPRPWLWGENPVQACTADRMEWRREIGSALRALDHPMSGRASREVRESIGSSAIPVHGVKKPSNRLFAGDRAVLKRQPKLLAPDLLYEFHCDARRLNGASVQSI